jgi:hypothetical protein
MIVSVRIVTPKSKAKGKGKGKTGKKNVSAAAMLKKQSKVVKNRSPQNETSFKEAPVPSKYRSRLAKGKYILLPSLCTQLIFSQLPSLRPVRTSLPKLSRRFSTTSATSSTP